MLSAGRLGFADGVVAESLPWSHDATLPPTRAESLRRRGYERRNHSVPVPTCPSRRMPVRENNTVPRNPRAALRASVSLILLAPNQQGSCLPPREVLSLFAIFAVSRQKIEGGDQCLNSRSWSRALCAKESFRWGRTFTTVSSLSDTKFRFAVFVGAAIEMVGVQSSRLA